jgi:hypothetical protein
MPETAEPKQQLGLDAITAPPDASNSPDESTQLETATNEKVRLEIENEGLKQNIAERKKYAHRIFCMISIWLVGVLVILLLDGFAWDLFHLPDPVILAVIGGTTVNVLGIFYIVTNYPLSKAVAVSNDTTTFERRHLTRERESEFDERYTVMTRTYLALFISSLRQ